MSDDDRSLRWREANIPLITNGRNQIIIYNHEDSKTVTPTELHRGTIASGCYWDEARVRSAIG